MDIKSILLHGSFQGFLADISSHDYLIVFLSDFRGEKNQLPRKLAYPLKTAA